MSSGKVIAVCMNTSHREGKIVRDQITLVKGFGVKGDAHFGSTDQHLKKNAGKPNLRQVHLIHQELHQEISEHGFKVLPGQMGENITTKGIDLLKLPKGTILRFGKETEIELTGLRNPCKFLDSIQPGLMQAMLQKDEAGNPIPKTGVMSIVLKGGIVRTGDEIEVVLPVGKHQKLAPV